MPQPGRPGLFWILLLISGCGNDVETGGEETASAAAPVTELAADAPPGRLADNVRPVAYRVDLHLDPRLDSFGGTVAIDVEIAEPTSTVWLHGEGLAVSAATAVLPDGTTLTADYQEVMDPGVAMLGFSRDLPAGAATLLFEYETEFDRSLAGLFKVVEQDDPYALAKSESIQARSYMPGFDEPGFKATFDISLTIPEGFEAIGNSPVASRTAVGDGMERVSFATTPPMPTYLLSLAVGPFDVAERPPIPANDVRKRSIPLRGITRNERGDDMNLILDVTPGMLEIFETELQRPYPFEKLDLVAAPQWPSGGTELSAAITYREERILLGDDPAPGARLAMLGLHAHEIAHMWFGNLVTPPWWDDLWLKEGFATWATPLVLTILEPEGGHELNAATGVIYAMQLDSLKSTRAIREPITHNDDIRNAYDAITYAKSLGVIHMVDEYFGPKNFRPALGRYIESFADGTADSDEFYRVIGEETGEPALTDTFRSFVEQTGVPLLDVVIDCDADSVATATITQARYRPLGSQISDADKRWTIPVCLRSDVGETCAMLTEPETVIPLEVQSCPNWLLPNAGGSGYFRWNLSADDWANLIAVFGLLTPVEQLSLIDSAFAAFEAGNLEAITLLDVIVAAASAGKRQVITAPLDLLRGYPGHYFGSDEREVFRQFTADLYRPLLEKTASAVATEDQLLNSQLLAFLALVAKDPAARAELRERAHAFTAFGEPRQEDALSSDLYQAALTVGIQDSGIEFFDHLLAFRSELDDPRFEADSASALGAVIDVELIDNVHSLALTGELGPRETFSLLSSAMNQPELRREHWQWLQDNFSSIVEVVPQQWRRLLPSLATSFCSENRLGELEALFERDGDLAPGHERKLSQTIEEIRLCAALADRGASLGASLPKAAAQ